MTTIAVIGHGRSPEGRGWGLKIDSCIVIRMWDWSNWQGADDYGTRFDYGLLEIHPEMMRDFYRYCKSDPEKGWIGSVIGNAARCKLPKHCTLVDQKPWNAMAKKMGGLGATGQLQFTRGTIAVCWAIQSLAQEGDSIVLVGFDNIHRGKTLPIEEAFSEIYRDQPSTFPFGSYVENDRRHGNHDFGIERPFMERLASEGNVTLQFAKDVW